MWKNGDQNKMSKKKDPPMLFGGSGVLDQTDFICLAK